MIWARTAAVGRQHGDIISKADGGEDIGNRVSRQTKMSERAEQDRPHVRVSSDPWRTVRPLRRVKRQLLEGALEDRPETFLTLLWRLSASDSSPGSRISPILMSSIVFLKEYTRLIWLHDVSGFNGAMRLCP